MATAFGASSGGHAAHQLKHRKFKFFFYNTIHFSRNFPFYILTTGATIITFIDVDKYYMLEKVKTLQFLKVFAIFAVGFASGVSSGSVKIFLMRNGEYSTISVTLFHFCILHPTTIISDVKQVCLHV